MNTNEKHRSMGTARLNAILNHARDLRVWVIGDIILDEYAAGESTRVSPEAPVPVVRVQDVSYRLGGAANVANQVAALGARPLLAGIVGRDEVASHILGLCSESGIDTRAVQQPADRPSLRKLRVLARQQQLVRLDWEDTDACPAEIGHHIVEHLRAGPVPDAVILSDYAKGLLTPELIDNIIHAASTAGVRVVVHPKRSDFSAYRGASVLTPNLHELQIATRTSFDADDTESTAAASRLLAQDAQAEALIVTLGARGMMVVPAREPPLCHSGLETFGFRCHRRRRHRGGTGRGSSGCRRNPAGGSAHGQCCGQHHGGKRRDGERGGQCNHRRTHHAASPKGA